MWNVLKKDRVNLPQNVDSKLNEYRYIDLKYNGKLMSFWSTLPKQNASWPTNSFTSSFESLPIEFPPDSAQFLEKEDERSILTVSEQSISGSQTIKRKIYETKAQDVLKTQIDLIISDLVGLYKRRDSCFILKSRNKRLKPKNLNYKVLIQISRKRLENRRDRKNQGKKKKGSRKSL